MTRSQGRIASREKIGRAMEWPFHPVFFGAFPVLALLRSNIDQVVISDAIRAIVLCVGFSLLLLAAHALVIREMSGSAVVASVAVLLFFSYGHIYSAIKSAEVLGIVVGRHRYLVTSCLLVYSIVLFRMRSSEDSARTTITLNLVSLVLVLMPLVGIIRAIPTVGPNLEDMVSDGTGEADRRPEGKSQLPDIYYIVPDSYLRADILEAQYDFENQEFLDFLESHDFYIAENSRANYMWTHQSLASSLNMNYVHRFIPGDEPGRRIDPTTHIQNSRVRMELEQLGYQTIGFVTGWTGSQFLDADVVLSPSMTRINRLRVIGSVTDFEAMLLYLTPARILLDLDEADQIPITRYLRGRLQERYDLHRQIILSLFENLKAVPEITGPKFVFLHILSPHSPYVFGPNGEPIDPKGPFTLARNEELAIQREKELYLDQLRFVNQQLMSAVEEIIDRSQRPVVIMIQSDHGFGADLHWEAVVWPELEARMSILNAYHLSSECRNRLYPKITPVNSFRIIFDCELGREYPLVEDTVFIGYDRFVPLEEYLEIRNIPSD